MKSIYVCNGATCSVRGSARRLACSALLILVAASIAFLMTSCSAVQSVCTDTTELKKDIAAVEKKYENSNGVISSSDVGSVKKEVLEAIKNDDSGAVKSYKEYDDGIRVEKSDGTVLIWQPSTSDVLSCSTGSTCTIQTVEPHRSAFLKENSRLRDYLNLVDSTARTLAGVSSKWTHNHDWENSAVTLENVSKLGSSKDTQIIYWMGHGFWTNEEGGILWLNEEYSDFGHGLKSRNGELVESAGGRVGITAKYVKNNISDLDGALVVLCSCATGTDDTLAKAFESAGASTVLAFDKTVLVTYGTELTSEFLNYLCTPLSSGKYPTSTEALDHAKMKYGYADPMTGARGVLFGSTFQISGSTPNPSSTSGGSTNGGSSGGTNSGSSSAYLKAYQSVLGKYSTAAKFQLCDVDKNGTPELFVSEGSSHVNGVDIYGYNNGSCSLLLQTGGGFGDCLVSSGTSGSVLESSTYAGVTTLKMYVLQGDAFALRRSLEGDFAGAGNTFIVDGKTVSERECTNAYNEIMNVGWNTIGYSTGHSNSASNRSALVSNPSSFY